MAPTKIEVFPFLMASMTVFGTLLLTQPHIVQGSGPHSHHSHMGEQEFGEICDPSPSQMDESLLCDSSKRLSCESKSLTCKCHHEERDIYDKVDERCETKVGYFCGGSTEKFPVVCIEHAGCNKTTSFCQCEEGYEKSDDGSKCEGNGSGVGPGVEQNVYLNTIYFTILLISVFVCN